jgi:activator of 2-hydroxyglutaryl-CoA dehydratase
MYLIDAGTSYIKIADEGNYSIIKISDAGKSVFDNIGLVTGHNCGLFSTESTKSVNELVALTRGAKKIIGTPDFLIIDIGSRDVKLIEYKNGNFDRCDWNTNCGAMIGFTIELMMKYFNKEGTDLPDTDKIFDVTCGLLGITKFFDSIADKNRIDEAMSALIAGLARFVWQFAGKPQKLYLSGGLTEHKCFIMHMNKLVQKLYPLGRFVLLKGLEELFMERRNNERTIDSIAGH